MISVILTNILIKNLEQYHSYHISRSRVREKQSGLQYRDFCDVPLKIAMRIGTSYRPHLNFLCALAFCVLFEKGSIEKSAVTLERT